MSWWTCKARLVVPGVLCRSPEMPPCRPLWPVRLSGPPLTDSFVPASASWRDCAPGCAAGWTTTWGLRQSRGWNWGPGGIRESYLWSWYCPPRSSAAVWARCSSRRWSFWAHQMHRSSRSWPSLPKGSRVTRRRWRPWWLSPGMWGSQRQRKLLRGPPS